MAHPQTQTTSGYSQQLPNSGYVGPTGTQVQQPPTGYSQTNNNYNPNNQYNQSPSQSGLVTQLAGQYAANQALGQNAQNIASAAGQKISDIGGQGARGEAGYLTTGTVPVGGGNAAITAQTTAAQQQAVAQGAQQALAGNAQALTAQNQGQAALGTAAGYNQQQVSPGTAVIGPNGQEIYSGLGGLTGLGIAQQNISEGQSLQGQAQGVSTSLQQLNQLTPQITQFLTQAGINEQTSPAYNQAINTYQSQLNPANQQAVKFQMQALKNAVAPILLNQGLSQSEVDSFDPSNLSPNQLNQLLQSVQSVGNTELNVFQQNASSAYNSGRTPYVGQQASPFQPQPSNQQPNNYGLNGASNFIGSNPLAQAGVGVGINAASSAENILSGLVGYAAKAIGL